MREGCPEVVTRLGYRVDGSWRCIANWTGQGVRGTGGEGTGGEGDRGWGDKG